MSRALALLLATLCAATTAGCVGPYYPQIESRELQRPDPPLTPADLRALEPYAHAPYFQGRS